VTVEMKGTGRNSTHVEVTAREGVLNWDKDHAKDILSRIIERS
jgi:hypothetical protein